MTRPCVLVVEDGDDIRDSLVEYLRRCLRPGEVLQASDLGQARAILASQPVDVILSDHFLPDGDGTTLLQEQIDARPHIVRFLMTAFPENDVLLEACNRARVAKVYQKPFDPSRLAADIARAADGQPIPPDAQLTWL